MKKIIILSLIIIGISANNLKIVEPKKSLKNNSKITTKKIKTKDKFQSNLLNELEIVLDKVNKKEDLRKIKLEKEYKRIERERKNLQIVKDGLVKERMAKGVIIEDDVQQQRLKLEKKRQLLQQKIQYAQVKEQYNTSNIDNYKTEVKNRIIFYKKIQETINNEYIINSNQFDFLNINKEKFAYVSEDIINNIIKEGNNDIKKQNKYKVKVLILEEALKLNSLNKLKQILAKTAISPINRTLKMSNNISNNSKKVYIKILTKQELSKNIFVKSISENSIIIKRN